jgi:DNA polymerase-3 subunit epsilon
MWRRIRHLALCGAILLAVLLAGLVIADSSTDWHGMIPQAVTYGLAVAVLAVAAPLLAYGVVHADRVGWAIERLRGFIVLMQTDTADAMPQPLPGDFPKEVQALLDAVDSLIDGRLAQQSIPARQLETVLSALPDAIVVINHAGLVSLINAAAKTLLGMDVAKPGTSVYDALDAAGVERALAVAEGQSAPAHTEVDTVDGRSLPVRVAAVDGGRGAVLTFDPPDGEAARTLDHDLQLLEMPPPVAAVTEETPLDALPVVVFDLETTGLDVAADTIVSVGGVRLQGSTIYRAVTIDCLVHPGRPIPPRSTAIHGITNDMVEGAPDFSQVWPDFRALSDGTVLVGHNVGFDIAHLQNAAKAAGLDWSPPPYLCTYLLTAALDLGLPSLQLDSVAESLGVRVRGRHTALGDALVTAEVFARLLPRLADSGVATLGEAVALSRRRKDILREQEKSGWWTGQSR